MDNIYVDKILGGSRIILAGPTGFTCRCRTEARRQRVLQQIRVGGSEIVASGLSVAITFPDSCDRTA